MRSLTFVKEVQQLTERLVSLSRFLSCVGDKSIHFFVTIKKSGSFQWTEACEQKFMEFKKFLSAPSILVYPKENSPLTLYLAVSDKAISYVLVQDSDEGERPIYFVSKVLKGEEIYYQNIKRLALEVVVTTRKLRQYFQGHTIIVKTNYPIKRILNKSDLAGRMMAWAIELSEYDISFTPMNNIKS